MDPLSALGLASSIIQCVQFVGKIVSQSKDIYHSARGMTQDAASLSEIAGHLSSINNELASQSLNVQYHKGQLSPAEMRLQELLHDMRKVNSHVLGVLRDLEIRDGSVWESVKLALKSVWHENDVQQLENRLDEIRKQLDTTLLICIR